MRDALKLGLKLALKLARVQGSLKRYRLCNPFLGLPAEHNGEKGSEEEAEEESDYETEESCDEPRDWRMPCVNRVNWTHSWQNLFQQNSLWGGKQAQVQEAATGKVLEEQVLRPTQRRLHAVCGQTVNVGPTVPSGDDEVTVGEKLCKAAARGDLAALRKYIGAEGASVNACDYDQRSALHLAAAEGHESAVSFLLHARADVNAQDRWGGTPLKDAERGWHVSVMQLLQRRGGTKPDSDSILGLRKSTPELSETALGEMLCHAAAVGDIRAIKRLVSQGASVNFCDYDRRSALHLVSSLAAARAYACYVRGCWSPVCAGALVSSWLMAIQRGSPPVKM
jgi:hypothetical protein